MDVQEREEGIAPSPAHTNGSGPALLPLEGQELAEVLDGLLGMVERTPGALTHPTAMLTVRLALAASAGVGSAEALETAQNSLEAASEGLGKADHVHERLRGQVAEMRGRANRAAQEIIALRTANEDIRQRERALAREVENLQGQLDERPDPEAGLDERLARTTNELLLVVEVLERRADMESISKDWPVARKVASLVRDCNSLISDNKRLVAESAPQAAALKKWRQKAEKATRSDRETTSKLTSAQSELTAAQTKSKNPSKRLYKKVMTRFDTWEFSAQHRTQTFRGSGDRCPCCPVCSGLDPNKVTKSDLTGHKSWCSVLDLKHKLKGLQPT